MLHEWFLGYAKEERQVWIAPPLQTHHDPKVNLKPLSLSLRMAPMRPPSTTPQASKARQEPIQETTTPHDTPPLPKSPTAVHPLAQSSKASQEKSEPQSPSLSTPAPATQTKSQPPPTSPQLKKLRDTYLSRVQQLIERHKYYPDRAKQRREEGVVLVRFTIASDGKIVELSIAKRSAYRRLDRATLKGIKSIGQFPPIPPKLQIAQMTLTVPIYYKID